MRVCTLSSCLGVSRCRQARACSLRRRRVLLRHGQRVGAGGGVGAGGAGGDHVQRVADNVGQNDRIDRCRGAGLGKAAALDAGQALAHRVHLDDVGAAGQQLPGDVLQFPAGDQRLLKQRAAAAGQQKQHGVAGAQAADQFQRPAGGGKAVFVRHRVAGLVAGTAGQLALDMAVFRHHHAGGKPAAQAFHRGAGHLPGPPCRRRPAAPGRGTLTLR